VCECVHVSSGFIMTVGHRIAANGEHGGKTLLKSTALHLLQHEVERERERERDGGHSEDKAVLFLIYVLL